LINQPSNRTWPVPKSPWVQFQRWDDLLFAHWPIPVAQVQPFIPSGLALDTFEGQAWLGLVPFEIAVLRWHGLPTLPGLAGFPEVNVRTYVKADDKPGVYFFSLDAAKLWAVVGARLAYHLPYFHAKMQIHRDGDWVHYYSQRIRSAVPAAEFEARYRPVGEPALARRGTLDYWLTERYCLYAVDWRGQLYRGDIHHAPWSLQPAELEITTNTLTQVSGFAVGKTQVDQPLLHFSRSQEVFIWLPSRVKTLRTPANS
jgi:uncharacterized protein